MPTDNHLRVITLNMWGLGFNLAKDRARRFLALGKVLPSLEADVIALQEIWREADQQYICHQAAGAGLGYAHYFSSGVLGSGLLTLSRYPIIDVTFQPFRMRSQPERIMEGDFYAGKGIGLTRLAAPGGVVDVYNVHAVAQYVPDVRDRLAGARASNMYEVATFINGHSQRNPVILMGDYNVTPRQLGYRLVTTLAALTDCYAHLHPDETHISAELNNRYSTHNRERERIDYICVRDGDALALTPQTAQITLKQRPEYPHHPYSDHYAVQVDLALQGRAGCIPTATTQAKRAVLEEFDQALLVSRDEVMARRKAHRWQVGMILMTSLLLNMRRTKQGGALLLWRSWGAVLMLLYGVLQWVLFGFFTPQELRGIQAIASEVRVKIIAIEQQTQDTTQ